MGRQKDFKVLSLRGTEVVTTSSVTHLCNHPGCWKFIEPGEKLISLRNDNLSIRVECAEAWCDRNGVEAMFKEKV